MKAINNQTVFDPSVPCFNEAYYVIWVDPEQQLSMVMRYVLFNGPDAESKVAQVWAWFWDRVGGVDLSFRQVYPLDQATWSGERCDLRIGKASGITEQKAWGRIVAGEDNLEWDLELDMSQSVGVDRMLGANGSDLFPRFRSPGCKHCLSGTVTANGRTYELNRVNATDGHYWNVQNLQTWSWANCVNYAEDPDAVFEGIGYQLYRTDSPVAVSAAVGTKEGMYTSQLPESLFRNRELKSELECWEVEADYGDQLARATVTGDPNEMILIVHPLPDGSCLFTTISLTASSELEIFRKEESGLKLDRKLTSERAVAFEVTKPVRNPRVSREFRIVAAPSELLRS